MSSAAEIEKVLEDVEWLTLEVENSSPNVAFERNRDLQERIAQLECLLDQSGVYPGQTKEAVDELSHKLSQKLTPPTLGLVSTGPLSFNSTRRLTSSPPYDQTVQTPNQMVHTETRSIYCLTYAYVTSLREMLSRISSLSPVSEGVRLVVNTISSEAELCEEILSFEADRGNVYSNNCCPTLVLYSDQLKLLQARLPRLQVPQSALLNLAILNEIGLATATETEREA